MSKLIEPIGYQTLLDRNQTEQGIKKIKDFFQQNLSTELRLHRLAALARRAPPLHPRREKQNHRFVQLALELYVLLAIFAHDYLRQKGERGERTRETTRLHSLGN